MNKTPLYKTGDLVYYRNSNPIAKDKIYLATIKDGLYYDPCSYAQDGYFYSIQLKFFGTKLTVHEDRLLPCSLVTEELFY